MAITIFMLACLSFPALFGVRTPADLFSEKQLACQTPIQSDGDRREGPAAQTIAAPCLRLEQRDVQNIKKQAFAYFLG
jgi:hypothetical protein